MDYDGKIRIKTELDVKSFYHQINDLENQLKEQKDTLEKIKNAKPYEDQKKDLKNYQIEIEKTTNKLAKLRELQLKQSLKGVSNIQYNKNPLFQQELSLNTGILGTSSSGINLNNSDKNSFQYIAENIDDLRDAFPDVEEKGKKSGDETNKSFSKGVKTLKKFGLSLFGIRTAFALVSKASNAYLSEHTATAQKLQSVWIALGNIIGPVLDSMADGFLKIIGYLDVFIKTLTNGKIDITKGMYDNKKSIDSTTEAMKKLNSQVYSFDEMNIEQDESDYGGESLEDYSFKMPELDPKIIDFLKEMADLFRENWDWIWKVGAALGVVFGVAKISSILQGAATLLSVGLNPLVSAFRFLATVGVIFLGVDFMYTALTGTDLIDDLKDIWDYLQKIKGITDGVTESQKENNKESKKWQDNKNKEIDLMKKGSHEANLYFDQLRQLIETSALNNSNMAESVNQMSGMDYWFAQLDGTVDEYNERLKDNFDAMRNSIQSMADMYSQGKLTENQERQFFDILKSVNGELVDGKVKFTDMDTEILSASKHTEDYNKVLESTAREVSESTSDMANNSRENLNLINQELSNVKNSVVDNVINKFNESKDAVKEFIDKFNETKNLKSSVQIDMKANTSTLQSQLEKLKSVPVFGDVMANALSQLKTIGLDSGGIVSNPGRGVPIGYNVVAGERRREGVLPLTDEGAMQELGYEIGRWITINATLNNYISGRVVQKDTRQISNQNGYLTNGRVM